MEQMLVQSGRRLQGTVEIEGAKNAVLPIMAAALLAEEGTVTLKNVPRIDDVYIMADILRELNVEVEIDAKNNQLTINAEGAIGSVAPYELVEKMRASIVVMGPILARNHFARVSMPGGDAIGARPIDLHLKGFEALQATTVQTHGYVEAKADELVGTRIYLDFPSVGATQNIMMAAVLARGTTVIENVAAETEIVDLANVLSKMGAKIYGAGTDLMKIVGVKKLHGATHRIVQDRIEAGTFMIAAALTGGDVLVKEAIHEHNRPLISKLQEMGAEIHETEEGIRVIGPDVLKPTNIKTMPHPGFPTDLQAQMTVLQAAANGVSLTRETVFENRFKHLEEMRRMNLTVQIDGQVAVITGGKQLQGALVHATDIRAAAALVLAGLVSNGLTRVDNLEHLDRGYYQFHKKLAQLGANIQRVSIEEKKVKVKNNNK
ncbi:MAG: UDP-N-acetylglucosamine 1-carboxyvinyltransferase [Lactobacillales bacterium]|nr:UDP-N-acetylglucosamine 1-carboxyvinyltransferase [Lactobacillales bacterium]